MPTKSTNLAKITPEQARDLLERVERQEKLLKVGQSFAAFLPHWKFKNRDKGEIITFENLWPGQQEFVELMEKHQWIYALKAGKLGFTELECAYDAWVARFRSPNTRVHVFSMTADAALEVMRYIEFGLSHLPDWMRPDFLIDEAGGKTTRSLRFRLGPDDERTIVSFAAGPNVSIDRVCQHAHVDELSQMPFAEQTWSAIYSTVAEGIGTCHVVTRGRGEDNFGAKLWKQADAGSSSLTPFFQPWTQRPREAGWYAETEANMPTLQQLKWMAPEKPEDALAGDETWEFVPIEWWDRCKEEGLPELVKLNPSGPATVDQTPLIVAVDAGQVKDCFGIVAVSRHPTRHNDVAVRGVRLWKPPKGGEIDFSEPEAYLRMLYLGGCPAGHPQDDKRDDCEACTSSIFVPPHNVLYVVYDEWQLVSVMQRLRDEGLVAFRKFKQQKDRAVADSELRDLIMNRRIVHDGNTTLREHVMNAAADIDKKEERRIRICKKSPERKVDLLVALSMASYRCLKLLL